MGRIATVDAQRPAPGIIAKAADTLKTGAAVIFPTDTVYGLGVLASGTFTPDSLYAIKRRDPDKAIPLLVSGAQDIVRYGADLEPYAVRLANLFWPGALTLVVKASDAVPEAFRAQDGTVALRAPANPICQAILAELDAPVATSSANLQGCPAPASVADLDQTLVDAATLVLDGGDIRETGGGEASTIVSCLGTMPHILREGALTADDLMPATETPVKKTAFTYPSADGHSLIHAIRWEPADIAYPAVKGVVQIVHGMVEYVDRYDHVARALVQAGFVVVGNDHIGHGSSVVSPEDWGKMPKGSGAEVLVEDVDTLRRITQDRVGRKKPYFLYGHSMGSFITRVYLSKPCAEGLSGAVISGTGHLSPFTSKMGKALNSTIGLFKGPEHRSTLVNGLAIGSYNKAFEPSPTGTAVDWLSRDENVSIAYSKEPRNNFVFTIGAFDALLTLTADIVKPECMAQVPKDLPVLFIAGDKDPVGEFGKGPTAAAEAFRKAGVADVELVLYPGCRHELHNELNKDEIIADVLVWLERKIDHD